MSKNKSEAILYPGKTAIILGWVVIFLVFAQLITHFIERVFESDLAYGLARFFELGTERNVPTFFSICLFVISAVLFLMVWKAQRARGKPQWIWMILSGIFCFLATDELSSLHEQLSPHVKSALGASGIFYFAWIIPYGIAVSVLSIFVIPVIWRIDKRIRFWFGLSAATFFTGAVGLEMLEGWYWETVSNQKDLANYLFMTFEESLEMIGLVMLVFALLSLLQTDYGGFSIHIPGARGVNVSSHKPDAGVDIRGVK